MERRSGDLKSTGRVMWFRPCMPVMETRGLATSSNVESPGAEMKMGQPVVG